MYCEDLVGPAHDLYCIISQEYLSSKLPINVSGKHAVIIKFLEDKDYITTHETPQGDIYAKPSKRISHRLN